MTADEVVLLCALLDDAGCSEAMVLAVVALYCSPVERPVVPNIRFCLTATTDVDVEFDFRFDLAGILQLASLFELPEWVITKHRDRVHKTEALCILLYHLSYPKRLADMRKTFGRSEGALSRIFLHMGKVTLLYALGRWHIILTLY
uniref:DDE Tnp4 domain-containing protein n=1 Tax=Phytophthora ramorum TaxID=164328 RepID=H3H937_PHYRM